MTPLTLHDYFEIALRRKWWIIIPLILSVSGAAALTHVLPKLYRSSTLILVEPQKVPEDYVKVPVTGSIEDRLATIRQQVLSRSLLQRVIVEFYLSPNKGNGAISEDFINSIRKHITIDTVTSKDVGAFTISFIGNDPVTTMNVTNKLASQFIEENLRGREQLVEGTTDFLETELKSLKATLEDQEQKVSNYKQRYMGSLPSQLDANLRTLDRLQFQLQTLDTSIREAQDRYTAAEHQMEDDGSVTPGAPLQDNRVSHLQMLKKQLAELQASYTENYPDVVVTKQEIAHLESELRSANIEAKTPTDSSSTGPLEQIKYEIVRLKEQQKAVSKQIADYQKRVEETPKREEELGNLLRDYNMTQNSYDTLLGKASSAKIAENLEKRQKGENFRIVDPANYPEKPFSPDPLRFLAMGFLIGAGIGGALIVMLEATDTSFRKAEDLEKEFGFPVLCVIPHADILQKVGKHNGAPVDPKPSIRGG